ncbi:MAG: RND family transporter [Pirellulales bacterium]
MPDPNDLPTSKQARPLGDPTASRLPALAGWLIRWRLPIFLCGLVLTAAAIWPASQLRFDQSIESLYSQDNPRLRDYAASKEIFGGDQFVVVAYSDAELFTPAGQQRLSELGGHLEQVPGVVPGTVQSLAGALATANFPFLAARREQLLDLLRGVLLGDDNQTTAVLLRIAEERNAPCPRGETIAHIRRVAAEHPLPCYVVGEPVQVHDMFRYAQEDGELLGWTSSLLLGLVILVLFRSVRWVLIPLAVVYATVLWTKGLIHATNMQLSMVSSILTALVTIIGVATVVHLALYYRELRGRLDREAALRQTFTVLGGDLFWVCATTAAGFAAQFSSHVFPVRSFGVMMSLGALLVLPALAAVVPFGALAGKRGGEPRRAPAEGHVHASLGRLTAWVEHHPWRLGIVCLIFTLLGLAGLSRLRVETDFSKNFRANSPIVQSLQFVETRLGGAGVWEVNFPAPRELTPEYLEQVRRLAAELRRLQGQNPSLTKVVAVSDGVDLIPQVPFLSADLIGQLRVLKAFQPQFLPGLYNPQRQHMRILLRAREQQTSEERLRLIGQVEQTARRHFPQAQATGLFVLLTFLIDSLLADQWINFALGVAGVVGMMTLAYRSPRIGLIALAPNLLPIVLVVGAMGWIGLPINIATAMISTVTMGLTVDASIFYLSAFLRARRAGLGFYEALHETQQEVGRALVYSNLALILGFLVLCLSHFIPLVYFGVLVSVAILGGLAGNLVLLPLLLRLTERGK